MYDINQRWAISAAYMIAIGSTPQLTATSSKNPSNSVVQSSIVGTLRAPTLNSAMFGVRYQLMD